MAEHLVRLPDPPRGCGGPPRSDWPHRVTLGLGDVVAIVATDAPDAAERLAPWRVDDLDGDVDYYLEVDPVAVDPRSGVRPLPTLWHGACPLVRTSDRRRLTTALLRVLASHGSPAPHGQLRVELVPATRQGVALLVPPAFAAAAADRVLLARGVEVVHTGSTRVDVRTGAVHVDAPLGSDERQPTFALGGWWVPAISNPEEPLSPGRGVAEVMQLVHGITAESAAATLRAVAHLVERVRPEPTPGVEQTRIDDLVAAVDRCVASASGGSPR